MIKDNAASFMKGLDKAKDLIHTSIVMKFIAYGLTLLEDADTQRTYTSFTGNTLTSLAFGYYLEGNLSDVVFINREKAVHAKVKNGEWLYLEVPYEGKARKVQGKVDITDDYGFQTSQRFLESYMPTGGNGIVITTGTEYSTFLETMYDMNVLSDTYLNAAQNSLNWMKTKFDKEKPIEKQ